MTPLQILTWMCVILVVLILFIGWIYAVARMVSYGWHRGRWRAERDNKCEENQKEDADAI